MQFSAEDVLGLEVEAAALDASAGGFHASSYVRCKATGAAVWSEENLFGGREFKTAQEALQCALAVGRARAAKLLAWRSSSQLRLGGIALRRPAVWSYPGHRAWRP